MSSADMMIGATETGFKMSNGRPFRRTLSATLVGATLMAGSVAPPAGADQPNQSGDQGPEEPVLWSGTLSADSADAIVNVRVDALNDDVPDDEAFVNLDGASADADGVTTIRAEPGQWYDEFKDADGRVQVTLFASSDNGDQFGMELLYLRWVDADDGFAGHWISDKQLIEAEASQQGLATGALLGTLASNVGHPPTSEIRMSAAPQDLSATRSSGNKSAGYGTRSIHMGGYTCDGPKHFLASGLTWTTIGKYYSSAGPTENWEYQTSSWVCCRFG